jgi:hypothetical protein
MRAKKPEVKEGETNSNQEYPRKNTANY